MSRAVAWTGLLFVVLGLAIFLWKTLGLGLPLIPTDVEGLWRVELEIAARGVGRRGSLRAALPSSEPGQVVFDESSASDRLLFTIRTDDGGRVGVWSGRFEGLHEVVHGFRVELDELVRNPPEGALSPPSDEIRAAHAQPTVEFPAAAPEVLELLEDLPQADDRDVVGRTRALFAFVSNEIASVDRGSGDALLTLSAREGSPEGKTRLLVTLLRASGVPARSVLGLRLAAGHAPETVTWAQAWIGGKWVPMSPTDGFFGRRPKELLVLRRGGLEAIEATGLDAVTHRYHALREHLRPEELAVMMVPPSPLLAPLSLYRLPLRAQGPLRLLLLLPLGALVTAVFRNLIGVPTFGTFMPALIALALRESSLGIGLAMIAAVIGIGILGRLVLDRLHLLLVPRLSILLCLVVLSVTAFAALGRGIESRGLSGGVLLPIVILTMLIERFSVTLAEEGLRPAMIKAGWSTFIAVAVFPIYRSVLAAQVVFGYPELVVVVIGLLVWIGGYTGYRISDLLRFRSFAQPQQPAAR